MVKEFIWEIEMYKNIGTIATPIMKWVADTRIYFCEKTKDDFDLHDVEGLRRNARQIVKPITNMRTMEHKLHEYIGDAVYELILRETMIGASSFKHAQMGKVSEMRNNIFMNKVGKAIGLIPQGSRTKKYANAVEATIYKIYKSDGIEGARKWFENNVIKYYNTQHKQ